VVAVSRIILPDGNAGAKITTKPVEGHGGLGLRVPSRQLNQAPPQVVGSRRTASYRHERRNAMRPVDRVVTFQPERDDSHGQQQPPGQFITVDIVSKFNPTPSSGCGHHGIKVPQPFTDPPVRRTWRSHGGPELGVVALPSSDPHELPHLLGRSVRTGNRKAQPPMAVVKLGSMVDQHAQVSSHQLDERRAARTDDRITANADEHRAHPGRAPTNHDEVIDRIPRSLLKLHLGRRHIITEPHYRTLQKQRSQETGTVDVLQHCAATTGGVRTRISPHSPQRPLSSP
jgi:hypothetical protein